MTKVAVPWNRPEVSLGPRHPRAGLVVRRLEATGQFSADAYPTACIILLKVCGGPKAPVQNRSWLRQAFSVFSDVSVLIYGEHPIVRTGVTEQPTDLQRRGGNKRSASAAGRQPG